MKKLGNEVTENYIRIGCDCGSQIHSVQLDIDKDDPDLVFLSISYFPTTLWAKFKQLFDWIRGYDSLVADVVLSNEDMEDLISFYALKRVKELMPQSPSTTNMQ